MLVAIGADHGGFMLKNELVSRLQNSYDIKDLGAYQFNPNDDYPDFVVPVCRTIISGEVEKGIIVCGSGVGACVAANKIKGIRAGLCHDTYSAHQGVEHDDMNILCLGAWVIGTELAIELATAFLNAHFKDEERFRRRLDKVIALEKTSDD